MTLSEMIQARDALDAQIDSERTTARTASIAQIHFQMAQHGLTHACIAPPKAPKAPRAAKSTSGEPRAKLAPKYANGTDTWTGRGLTPKWLTALVVSGYDRESYRVQSVPPPAL